MATTKKGSVVTPEKVTVDKVDPKIYMTLREAFDMAATHGISETMFYKWLGGHRQKYEPLGPDFCTVWFGRGQYVKRSLFKDANLKLMKNALAESKAKRVAQGKKLAEKAGKVKEIHEDGTGPVRKVKTGGKKGTPLRSAPKKADGTFPLKAGGKMKIGAPVEEEATAPKRPDKKKIQAALDRAKAKVAAQQEQEAEEDSE